MHNPPRLHRTSSRENPTGVRRLYTARDAAALVGVTADTLREWEARDLFPRGFKQGTTQQARRYYQADAVDRWLADRTAEATR